MGEPDLSKFKPEALPAFESFHQFVAKSLREIYVSLLINDLIKNKV